MVDPIEIKLDEIDSKIDQIIYAPKQPRYFEISAGGKMVPPGGLPQAASGNFLESILGKMTSGGSGAGGAAAAGAVAGGVAAAIMILADLLKQAIGKSKIISTVLQSVSDALGLLVDLILLPFLPALTMGIVSLYGAITSFGDWWKTVWDTIKEEGLIGLVKLGLQWIWDKLVEWEMSILKWLFSDKPLGEKIIDVALAIGSIFGGIFAKLGEMVIGNILDLVFGEGTYAAVKQVSFNIAATLIDAGITFIKDLLSFIFGESDASKLNTEITFAINLKEAGSQMAWDLLKGAYDLGTTFSEKTGVKSPQAIGGLVTPISPAAGLTLNFYGLTNDDLPGKIMEILRGFGAGWKL